MVMTGTDHLKGDPTLGQDVATDPAFKDYWGGINADGAALLVLRWTDLGYVGGPYGASAPAGCAAGDPKIGVSMLAKKATAVCVLEDCYFHGSVDDSPRTSYILVSDQGASEFHFFPRQGTAATAPNAPTPS